MGSPQERRERRPGDEPAFQRQAWQDMKPFGELRRRHPELAARAAAVDEKKAIETIFEAVRARPGVTSRMHARLLIIGSSGALISVVQESLETGEALEDLLDEAFTLLENGL